MQIHFLTSFLLILIVNQGRAQVVIEPSYSAFRYVGPQWARFLFYNPVTVLYTARTYSTTVTTFFTICTYSTTTSLPACALKRQLLTENEPKIAIAPTTIERYNNPKKKVIYYSTVSLLVSVTACHLNGPGSRLGTDKDFSELIFKKKLKLLIIRIIY